MRDHPAAGFSTCYIDVQDIDKPENFIVELTAELVKNSAFASAIRNARHQTTRFGRFIKRNLPEELSFAGFKAKFRNQPDLAKHWKEYAGEMLDLLDTRDGITLIIIDELGYMIERLKKNNPEQLEPFLDWFRKLRLARQTTRFLLTSSINFQYTLERLDLANTINDIHIEALPPFDTTTARSFIERTFRAEINVRVPDKTTMAMLLWIDPHIPYELALLISAILESHEPKAILQEHSQVETIFREKLLKEKDAYFRWQDTRIRKYYGDQAKGAYTLLDYIARQEEAAPRSKCLELLEAFPDRKDLIRDLRKENYLTQKQAGLSFYSRTLKAWWRLNRC
jgi:hypothetical protein